MAHYSINNIINTFEKITDVAFGVKSTPTNFTKSIFITRNQLLEKKQDSSVLQDQKYDTIIVGAGVAGLYAAYKIAKAKPEEKILIVEQSERTGGRLDTDLFSINGDLIKEEEGGMRFTFEDMPQLMNLFVELKLDEHIVPFPMHLDDNNRRSFRGRTFSAKESGRNNYKVWSDLYGLKNIEKDINPSTIIPELVYPTIVDSKYDLTKEENNKFKDENKDAKFVLLVLEALHEDYLKDEGEESSGNKIIDEVELATINTDIYLKQNSVIKKLKENDLSEYKISEKYKDVLIKQFGDKIQVSAPGIWQFFRLAFKWKGIELYKWTLWSMLADMGYSKECIEMMARVSGFNGCYYSTMNAGEAFQLLMEFPAEPDFKSLRYGFSQLTNALVDNLVKFGNVNILLETRVEKIENNAEKIDVHLSDLNEDDVLKDIKKRLISLSVIVEGESREIIKNLIEEYDSSNDKFKSEELKRLKDSFKKEDDNIEIVKNLIAYFDDRKKYNTDVNYKVVTIDDNNKKGMILALPRVALEKLINASDLPVSNENDLWNNLESTTNQPLAKINLYYDNAWWNSDLTPNADVTFGPNFTDLPLGSVYPFYSDPKEDKNKSLESFANLQAVKVKISQLKADISKLEHDSKADHSDEIIKKEKELKSLIKKIPALELDVKKVMKDLYTKPAALTIYCDYQNINFWQGFAKTLTDTNAYPQNNDKVRQIKVLKDYLKNPADKNNLIDLSKEYITPASNEMVAAITAYFQQLFQTNKVPAPIATSVRIWEGSQSLKTDAYGNFGYGVHQWGVGAKDNEVINTMIQPFGDLPIYTCGEAYSDFQGWVEGALRSTNLVLERMNIPSNFTNSSYKNNKELLQYLRAEYKNKFIKS